MELYLKGLNEIEKDILIGLLVKIELTEKERKEWDDALESEIPFEGGIGLEEGLVASKLALENLASSKNSNTQIRTRAQIGISSTIIEQLYTPIGWPDNQELMDKEWWEGEAILDIDSKTGDSTYLVPIHRLD